MLVSMVSGTEVVKLKSKAPKSCNSEAFELKFFECIDDAEDLWDQIVPPHRALMTSHYMRFLERYSPDGMKMRYIIVIRNKKPIGVIPCSLKRFEANESITLDEESIRSWIGRKAFKLRSLIVRKVSFNTLVCGNILFTGEYAFYFNEEGLEYYQQFNIVEKALLEYQYQLLSEGMNLNVTFMKDFYEEKGFQSQDMESSAFNEFKVQPSMILKFRPEWKGFDDYLASFVSKSRVRARKAFEKGTVFVRRKLTHEDALRYEDEMFDLYRTVSEKAGFNLFHLRKDYFTAMLKELSGIVQIHAYFLDGKLVAFYSSVCDGKELIAHFLGYDKQFIRSHDIYLNILYDLVRLGFETGCTSVNFGRTAMEIKSSVGAEPHDMFCYIKHRRQLNNLFVPHLVKYLNPKEEWKQRNPFKKQDLAD